MDSPGQRKLQRAAGLQRLLVVVAVGFLALGGWFFLTRGNPQANSAGIASRLEPDLDAASPTKSWRAASSQESQQHKRTARQRMTLPPTDVPLAAAMPELLRAVREGDVGAMCRLSYELQRCASQLPAYRRAEAAESDALLEPERPKNDPRSNEQLLRSLAELTQKREQLERICAGVKPLPGLEPWRLLRDAARAGHRPSMLRFSMSFPMNHRRFLGDIDGLEAFRDEGLGFLLRAEAAGDPTAAYHLFWIYNGNTGLLGSTGQIGRNDSRALAYAIALRESADDRTVRVLASQEVRLRIRLGKDEQREAEREAARLAPRFAASRGAALDLEQHKSRNSAEGCND